jgi:lipopolysaccharide transport system ATP-binding protein
MSDIAICVDHLGKRFRIGQSEPHRTFQEGLLRAASLPLRFVRDRLAGASEPSNREFWALQDVSFEVPSGEALGIIGHNGAGKSTLLKILSRITEPTQGRAEIRGRVTSLLEVGTGFHPELTGRENIFLNGAILGMHKAEIRTKFDEIVAFSGVEKFLNTPLKRYSTGMRVRLAFAVAAHLEPEILIIDEVLAVGDAAFQKKCLGKMGEVARGGRTVLFVSHNMSAIQRLCSRALVLSRGRLVADDTPSAAVAAYLSAESDSDQPAGDLTRLPRPGEGLGDLVRLTRCEVLDAAGRATGRLRFGEGFSVRVAARARSAHKDLSIVVAVDAPDDTRIATVASEESSCFFDASPSAPLSVVANFPDLELRPGSYSLTIGIRHGQRGLDQVPQAARFTVSEGCAPGVTPSAMKVGFLRARPAWSVAE